TCLSKLASPRTKHHRIGRNSLRPSRSHNSNYTPRLKVSRERGKRIPCFASTSTPISPPSEQRNTE
ncbi:hypothetical protein E4U28_002066, partial [Claviceps purpurea]